MTGKEIILEYLKTHEQFSPHELALITGIPNNRIAQAARHMVKQGYLSVVERKWKTVIYAKRKVKKEPIKRNPDGTGWGCANPMTAFILKITMKLAAVILVVNT
ncbi:hypothetical protein EJ366_05965 [Escherichia coli]|uniref:MarR family transcriptional regulator n=1 Tax=Escherichia coli TaxID=562 RepID=UPI0011F226D4|nr:helix-turn-helix domain-containing protein [Escherichia coli]KAA0027148.1 hypothetical protein EJ366_05965 [Escherichia coli]